MARNKVVEKLANGSSAWVQQAGDLYLATGVTADGKRFRVSNVSWRYIQSINLWKGSRWLVRGGKRYLIDRVTN